MSFRFSLLLAAAVGLLHAQVKISSVNNGATFTGQIAPGSLASIFGSGFTTSAPATAGSFPLPITLDNVLVSINSVPCPLLAVTSTQINFQVPYALQPGTATLVVTAGSTPSAPQTITVLATAPGIFPLGGSPGRAAAENQDGSINTSANPAAVGSILTAYMTGPGAVNPAATTGGQTPAALLNAVAPNSATIGGVNAPVQFLGLSPQETTGLAQANLVVPNLPSGDYPLVITVGGVSSLSAIVSVHGSASGSAPVLTLVGTAIVPENTLQGLFEGAFTVGVSGQYAYMCDEDKISVINISNPASPQYVTSLGQSDLNGSGSGCNVSGSNLVELIAGSQLSIYSLSNPAQPTRVGGTGLQSGFVCPASNPIFGSDILLPTCHLTYSVGSGQFLSQDGELEIYGFSNPASPSIVDFVAPNSTYPGNDNNSPRFGSAIVNSTTVAVLGTTAKGADPNTGTGQLATIDVTNPASPNYIGQLMIPQATILGAMAMQGNTALILGNTKSWENPVGTDPVTGGIAIPITGEVTFTAADFTSPRSPAVLGTTVTGVQSWGGGALASLGGGYFAVIMTPPPSDLHGSSTLGLINMNNPSNPVYTPVANLPGTRDGIAVSGNYLYVATGFGVYIYQIAP